MEQKIIEAGRECIAKLEQAGFPAYFVGGCVRDLLLNRRINDVDVATSARPEQVMALFAHAIPTGISHGTVTVLVDSIPVEVTTFRRESGYSDHRHPDAVFFVDHIEEDLARRDFTINALAMNLQGEKIDPYQGVVDLELKMIRGVGNPVTRFKEDPLRMLRGIRFAVQLGFAIEENTYNGMKECAPDIQYIAMERILSEWNKALMSMEPERALTMLEETRLFRYIPGLMDIVKAWAVYSTENQPIGKLPCLSQRLAYLFVKGNLAEQALTIMRTLKYDRKTMDEVKDLVAIVARLQKMKDEKELIAILIQYNEEKGMQGAALYELLEEDPILQKAIQVYNKMIVKQLRDLAVKGNDLVSFMQLKPGPWIHQVLTQLSLEVNLQLLPNEKKSLIERAKKIHYDYT